MRRSWWLTAAAVSTLCASAAVQAAPTGSASELALDAGHVQTWRLPGPETASPTDPPNMEVDLSVCGDLERYDEVVYGTAEADELVGGNRPQVLVGLGGDDVLRGGNQHDCLVGGPGDDDLHGGNGKDVLVGGAGIDTLDGGNGQDRLFGDDGAVECSAPDGDVLVDECGRPAPPGKGRTAVIPPDPYGSEPEDGTPHTPQGASGDVPPTSMPPATGDDPRGPQAGQEEQRPDDGAAPEPSAPAADDPDDVDGEPQSTEPVP